MSLIALVRETFLEGGVGNMLADIAGRNWAPTKESVRLPQAVGVQPLRRFPDVVELNETLDTQEFRSELTAARDYQGNVVEVHGTLYPYEPICAGSAGMWRRYWADMQSILRARLGPASPASSADRLDRVRDWWTQSLFLWGFSMARERLPDGSRWVGLATMDEINAVPVLVVPAAWEGRVEGLFAGHARAWEVKLTGHVDRRESKTGASDKFQEVFAALERLNYLIIQSPEQIDIKEKSAFFSAYIWALFETPRGRKYGLWEHANIADPDLFDDGVARLARKAGELCGPEDRLVAAVAPEVQAALLRRRV
jgi:hypothetical protein